MIYNDLFLEKLISKNGYKLIRSQGRTLLGYNKGYGKLVKKNSLMTSPLTGTTLLESGLNTWLMLEGFVCLLKHLIISFKDNKGRVVEDFSYVSYGLLCAFIVSCLRNSYCTL